MGIYRDNKHVIWFNIHLQDAGVPKGKTVGIIMKSLKDKWKDSDFLLSANELLEQIPKLLESVE